MHRKRLENEEKVSSFVALLPNIDSLSYFCPKDGLLGFDFHSAPLVMNNPNKMTKTKLYYEETSSETCDPL